MTHEQKLQAVTADIRAKLPRLINLEDGCLVFDKKSKQIGQITRVINDVYIIVWKDDKVTPNHIIEDVVNDNCSVIGKEPMLNDVLEWLSDLEIKNEELNSSLGVSLFYGKDFRFKTCKNEVNWDLSKPYLKDQSEELVNFLFELIKE